ncbi:MAG: hypothetical protein D6737_14155, partial [Chloroflexi bacterium]
MKHGDIMQSTVNISRAVNAHIHPTQQVIRLYSEAYQNLYKRTPRDLQALDNEWVIVNGAQMRVSELAHLTKQLQREYQNQFAPSLDQRRNVVKRLLRFFKQ